MSLHVYAFLLTLFLILSLVLLWCFCRLNLQPSHSPAGKRRPLVHRLLKPHTPLDCPICRLNSSSGGPTSAPVRPWPEVKSRRGAPKRMPTEGFACPNQQCLYFGITDSQNHALVGDGKHGRTEPIQTFRCQACHTTFTARNHTPLYRLKTPSQQVAMVLMALAEGLDASAAERVFGYRQATITTWLGRAGKHAQSFHEHFFCHLQLRYVQLDELHQAARLHTGAVALAGHRSPHQAASGASARLPHTFHGPSAHPLAPTVLDSWLPPALYERRLKSLLLRAHGPLWPVARGGSSRATRAPVAGGSRPNLRPGEKMLSAAQAGTCLARDASRYTG